MKQIKENDLIVKAKDFKVGLKKYLVVCVLMEQEYKRKKQRFQRLSIF